MIKFLLLLSFLSTSLFAGETFKKVYSKIENDQPKACMIAFGEYRRETKKHCEKLKKKINYDKMEVSKCIQEKISKGKFKATYKISFECK